MNTPNHWTTTAKILDGKRRELYAEIFSDAIVPIKCMFTIRCDLPGHPDAEAYMLDLDAISLDQRAKLIDVLATRFNITREEIAAELDRGVPILAENVSVMSTDLGMMMSMVDDDLLDTNLNRVADPEPWDDVGDFGHGEYDDEEEEWS